MASEAEIRRWVATGRVVAEGTLSGETVHFCSRCRQVLAAPWPATCATCGLEFAGGGAPEPAAPDQDGRAYHCPTCGEGYDDRDRVRCARCRELLPALPVPDVAFGEAEAVARLKELKQSAKQRALTVHELIEVAACYRALGDQAQAARAVSAIAALRKQGLPRDDGPEAVAAPASGSGPTAAEPPPPSRRSCPQPRSKVAWVVAAIVVAELLVATGVLRHIQLREQQRQAAVAAAEAQRQAAEQARIEEQRRAALQAQYEAQRRDAQQQEAQRQHDAFERAVESAVFSGEGIGTGRSVWDHSPNPYVLDTDRVRALQQEHEEKVRSGRQWDWMDQSPAP